MNTPAKPGCILWEGDGPGNRVMLGSTQPGGPLGIGWVGPEGHRPRAMSKLGCLLGSLIVPRAWV